MIVVVLAGIGICLLRLMYGKGDQRPEPEGDTMTTARLAQMLADDERERRRVRAEHRRPRGTMRVQGRRRDDAKGNRGNRRSSYAKEY